MKHFSLFVLILFFFNSFLFSQNQSEMIWQDKSESSIVLKGDRQIIPLEYRTLELEIDQLNSILDSAPQEFTKDARSNKTIISLPMPDGTFKQFGVFKSPVMATSLVAKYPEIKTYAGRGIDGASSVRLDITPQGFHAMILSPEGRVFIDPYSSLDNKNYISYYTRDFTRTDSELSCDLFTDDEILSELESLKQLNLDIPTGPQLRTYRLAVATTGEYSNFHGGTVPSVMAAIVTAVNRVTGVYETEVAVRMELIANNDTLIFLNASTDPYTNTDGVAMLTQNQTTIDARIGNANYDIGHVFSTGGGGVAYLGVICRTNLKARGVTGLPNPIGDPFYIDYVAHEMGHQYAGNHSFNGSSGSCSGGNRNASTAYEPGSGSTIMAYAGICSPQNLQNNSDPYFHTVNFDEIVAYTNSGSGNTCAVITNTGNNAPVVTVPAGGFYIPKSTPFALTGSATDIDGDALTYCWEEFDLGPAGSPTAPSGNAPIFRSWLPVTSPTRYFPRLQNLVNNTSVIGEILPTYTRNLTFRLVARDNKPLGGGVNYATVAFNVDGNSGPFVVTSPNTNVSWPGNSVQTITWDVSNTNAAPVNCANVNILLSVDGGFTYPYVLLSNTPNDGSEDVLIPDQPNTTSRIKVEAADNIFFDISNINFTIDQAIPVELISFAAVKIQGGVKLDWKTATETNNAGFTIERSQDNSSFVEIARKDGKGTTTQPQMYSYVDESVVTGIYYYRLKQTDYDGTFKYLNVVSVDVGLPEKYDLSQNHPNPFNPSTKIKFQLPADANVRIDVFNALGQRVSEIVNGEFSGGVHEVDFVGSDLSSGIYYYTISAAGKNGSSFVATRKMVMIK